jgi:isochorismate synthase
MIMIGARQEAERIRVLEVPAPIVSTEEFLEVVPGADAVVWAPAEGTVIAGVGVAARVDGADRLIDRAARLFERIDGPARVIGGMAFTRGAASEDPWSAFGDASFVLPRVTYERDGDRARLLVTGGIDPRPIVAALSDRNGIAHPPTAVAGEDSLTGLEPVTDDWRARIEAIRAAIASGRFEKIVAARRLTTSLDPRTTDLTVLSRLAARHPGCTRFAFRRDGATFLGATPERLVALRGLDLITEALAGSIAPGHDRSLLSSAKDAHEHALVVNAISARLAPLCSSLDVARTPQIRALPHVLHLRTPITGRLQRRRHILELVAALHPTPAVGGVPQLDAARWIASHEPPRGWYAAPIGWFDAHGDGDFAVALRCGLLAQGHAHLYAGAGIVADSDPAAEWDETSLKLRTLLDALTVRTT